MESLEEIRYCRYCDAIISIKDEICTFCQLDTSYKIPLHLEKLTFKECSDLINEAFFKIEMFLNGNQKTYQYFGFNDHFTKLFQLVNEMKNYTHENWDLVNGYLNIIHDIQYTHDKGIDVVSIAYDEEYFNNDCNELSTLLNYRIHEFSRFDNTPDYEYKRATILDLLENKPQQNEPDEVYKTQSLFKVGLLFATGEMNKYFTFKGNSAIVANSGLSPLKIATELGNPSFEKNILASKNNYPTNNTNGNKNIFNSRDMMTKIIEHCESKNLDIDPYFKSRLPAE